MARPRGGEMPTVVAPDAVMVNHRWIPVSVVEWVEQADAIMVEQPCKAPSATSIRRRGGTPGS
jgi:hypothetical protein